MRQVSGPRRLAFKGEKDIAKGHLSPRGFSFWRPFRFRVEACRLRGEALELVGESHLGFAALTCGIGEGTGGGDVRSSTWRCDFPDRPEGHFFVQTSRTMTAERAPLGHK